MGLLVSAPALAADPSPAQIQAAQKLFDKAIEYMDAHRFNDACDSFRASLHLDPKPGTVFALADCEASRGKLPEAIARYDEYLDLFAKMPPLVRERHAERAGLAEVAKKRLQAEILFNKAIEDRDAGRYDAACNKLSQSQNLDPSPGTVFALAECESTRGRFATALDLFGKYLDLYAAMKSPLRDRHGERAQLAIMQKRKLAIDAPRLKLVWVGDVPAGLVVTRIGHADKPVLLGSSFAVDPGEHVFITRVPGKPPVERKIRIQKGERKVLEMRPSNTTVVEDKSTGPSGPQQLNLEPAQPPGKTHPWRTGGIIAMGVGGTALLAGVVTGSLAIEQKRAVEAACDKNYVCSNGGIQEVDRFRLLGNTSTATFVIGGAAVAAGLTFFLLAPKSPETKKASINVIAGAAPGAAYVGLQGAFE